MLRQWQTEFRDRIDPVLPGSTRAQIVQTLIRDIERGRLVPGAYLPSTREMAQLIGANRKIVVGAYGDLVAQGWLETTSTSGTRVSASLPNRRMDSLASAIGRCVTVAYPFAPAPMRPEAPAPEFAFDEETPDHRLFPAELLGRAFRAVAQRLAQDDAVRARDPRGSPRLRRAIADMLAVQRGLAVDESQICVAGGRRNGLFLAAQILVEPGDAVIVEELTCQLAVAAFRALGARVVPVGLDEGGMCVDEIAEACVAHRVRAVFLAPQHQFPTTVALRPERRLALVQLARRFGFAIIEDDRDREFHFISQPPLPIAAYAPSETIHVGSLSALLPPALRIGYIAAPAPVIDGIVHRMTMTDAPADGLSEGIAAELIGSGALRRHMRKMDPVYARRRQSFAAMIDALVGGAVDHRPPDSGLASWIRFRGDVAGLERSVAVAGLGPYSVRFFASRDGALQGVRIGFGRLDDQEQRRTLEALAAVLPGAARKGEG